MTDDYKAYYGIQLEDGIAYQNFVKKIFLEVLRIPIDLFVGKNDQLAGESRQGIEIKLDKKMSTTGNLYIEVSEKAHPSNLNYVPSGIYRDDNSWLFVIGNYTKIFVFSIKSLQRMHGSGSYREVNKPTSRGFLLPVGEAEEYAARVIEVEDAEDLPIWPRWREAQLNSFRIQAQLGL